MGTSEKFCLRWNDFETNISSAFRELREEKDFFDVTLACDDSQIQAHKVILSACSPFFRNVLRRNPHQHPLLYLKGVKYNELLSVLNFMYLGEVNVAQEELNSFLAVAEDLRVKGLTQGSSGGGTSKPDQPKQAARFKDPISIPENKPDAPPPSKRPRQMQQNSALGMAHQMYRPLEDDDIQEVVPVKTEPREPPVAAAPAAVETQVQVHHSYQDQQQIAEGTVALDESYGDESYEYGQYEEGYEEGGGQMEAGMAIMPSVGAEGNKDPIAAREEAIMSNILRDNERKLFTCALCEFGASSRHKAFCHIEAKHFQDSPVTYSCQFCGKFVSSKNALGIHITRNHKEERLNARSVTYS
eukprot:TRINITY_DN11188_c0_g1_i5.p1 TRINITY_DN11188_c0_g1~~TRINITY_DN11188_c0_g1_i5.p1  ORF type:complete len:385 (-),score=96.79 TRINITY_DN11188_c0_g1_i5:794-1864(-)